MANDRERVGIIGVGRMGLAMAKHVINHGYPLTACDTNADNVEKARQLGAAIAATPAELGRTTRFVILGVGYDDEVNAASRQSIRRNGWADGLPRSTEMAWMVEVCRVGNGA
jgi:3-hydroxyisobutyrate dehydrogenase-like beta-hydroxyacid dehydrogenase